MSEFYHSDKLRSKRFRVVSEQRKTEERRGTGFSVLAAVFDTRSWLFAPKRHGNACYAG